MCKSKNSDTYHHSAPLWQYVYSIRTATVTVTCMDTLTEGGRGESGSMCTVHVLPQLLWLTWILWQRGSRGQSGSTCTVHVLPQLLWLTWILWQRGGRGESGSTCTVHVLPQLLWLTQILWQGREWQYVYSTCTAIVTVTYKDTLTEGGVGERVAVHVQYTYCHSYCVLHGYSDRRG